MVSVVLFAINTLYLSSVRSSLTANQDTKMQNELAYVFRDMEIYLRNGISGGVLTKKPDHNSFASPVAGPIVSRDTTGIWLGVVVGEGTDAVEIWLGYQFATSGTPPIPAKIVRKVYTIGAGTPAWTETTLSSGRLVPYADTVDSNGNGKIDAAEITARNTCIQDPTLRENQCELAAKTGPYPIFKVSDDKRVVYISLKAAGKIFGGKKDTSTSGMTRTIFLHSTAG